MHLVQRRPELGTHLRLPLDRFWSEVPAPVRTKVRAVVARTAPGALVMMPAGGATLGQDTSTEDLRAAVRDWADHLARVRATAENLWRAARVMNTATTAAARAASENPDAALDAAGRRLRDAASFASWGIGAVAVGAIVLLALWKR